MSTQHDTPTQSGAGQKVLVMEDETNVAKALQMILREAGYEVDVAMTGKGALDQFSNNKFDLLIADLRLPDIDGMEVIRKVKHDDPDTEVVVITGYSTVASAVEAMKLGASDFLPKPFTEDELKKIVLAALKNKKAVSTQETSVSVEHGGPQIGVLIQRDEVLNVLDRSTRDEAFWNDIMEHGAEALKDYPLRAEAKAAIVSGDLKWLNENVGGLTQKQLVLIYKRGEAESW